MSMFTVILVAGLAVIGFLFLFVVWRHLAIAQKADWFQEWKEYWGIPKEEGEE